ncbi:hypothetical protein OPV22_031588 [Ensete ventricosum]|uniref:VQ domain-containing protein n=1 Tax=Ensete ventricosum TaxID=4639 RepID=A0AAV8PT48_ENSVE|nr:hypothetical protein OPV22_031588 [Ensete ventricosum]
MAEDCSVLDPWMYRPSACIPESAFAPENDALHISLPSESASLAAGDPSRRRDQLTGRVSKKRKSRASKRSPTTYIAADPANFRELVELITGTPAVEPAWGQQHRPAAGQGSRLLASKSRAMLRGIFLKRNKMC